MTTSFLFNDPKVRSRFCWLKDFLKNPSTFCESFSKTLYLWDLISMWLSFTEPALHAMYYDDGKLCTYDCSVPTKERFIETVSMLRDMPSVDCLLTKWRCFDAKIIDSLKKIISVRVDHLYRLELGYNADHNHLTIYALSRTVS